MVYVPGASQSIRWQERRKNAIEFPRDSPGHEPEVKSIWSDPMSPVTILEW